MQLSYTLYFTQVLFVAQYPLLPAVLQPTGLSNHRFFHPASYSQSSHHSTTTHNPSRKRSPPKPNPFLSKYSHLLAPTITFDRKTVYFVPVILPGRKRLIFEQFSLALPLAPRGLFLNSTYTKRFETEKWLDDLRTFRFPTYLNRRWEGLAISTIVTKNSRNALKDINPTRVMFA